jgi:hypothetical protein
MVLSNLTVSSLNPDPGVGISFSEEMEVLYVIPVNAAYSPEYVVPFSGTDDVNHEGGVEVETLGSVITVMVPLATYLGVSLG